MAERNMTQTELAKCMGVSVPTVNWWVRGKSYPRDLQIEKMAKLFNIPVAELVIDHTSVDHTSVAVPILSSIHAGYSSLTQQKILYYEKISPQKSNMGTIFGLRIHGNSMAPKMIEGDIVLVVEQSDVKSGDIAVVMIGQEDATIKRVVKSSEGITLVPFNPEYMPISFTLEQINEIPVKIIGKAIELRSAL